MGVSRDCPVYRSRVDYASMCLACKAHDPESTACLVLSGKMNAHKDENGRFVVEKGGR